jgi:single-strand DNA-binding protein
MEITGRVTADAFRKSIKDDREVVQFSVAINDAFKPKGETAIKKITTYIDCSYWKNPGIAQYIRKGTIVEMIGNISARAYKNMDGEPKASLNFHVNTIKLHGGSYKTKIKAEETTTPQTDDLPF